MATSKVAAIAFSAQPSTCTISPPEIFKDPELGSKEGTEQSVRNLFRRKNPTPAEHSDSRDDSSLGAIVTVERVAAADIHEGLGYLQGRQPNFEVTAVQCVGLIPLVSGSPLD